MGKYKQWLHHQEIGRRLRDQINTYEQERARVQKMAPVRPTQLPGTDNPVIAALLAYTQQGHRLSEIDVIKAAMPKLDPDLDPRRPAGRPVTASASAPAAGTPVASAANPNVVASLLARAEQMPSDPMQQLNALSRAKEQGESFSAQGPEAPRADSMGGWWQRQRAADDE